MTTKNVEQDNNPGGGTDDNDKDNKEPGSADHVE